MCKYTMVQGDKKKREKKRDGMICGALGCRPLFWTICLEAASAHSPEQCHVVLGGDNGRENGRQRGTRTKNKPFLWTIRLNEIC